MMTSSGYGRSMIENLKELKCPEEGGTKQQHDAFLDKIKAHINVSWMYGGLLVKMIEDKEDPDFTLMIPADLPATGVSEGQKMIWKEKVKVAGAKEMVHEENKMALFSLVFTHLSKITQSKIEGTSGYESANSSKDPLWLLSTLDDVMIGFEKVKSPIVAMYDQLKRIMDLKQKENETNEVFIKGLLREIKVYNKHGGKFLWGATQDKELKDTMNSITSQRSTSGLPALSATEAAFKKKKAEEAIQGKLNAIAAIEKADKRRFERLQLGLKNQYLIGKDEYPKKVEDVQKILDNYKSGHVAPRTPSPRSPTPPRNPRRTSVSFLQAGDNQISFLSGTNGRFKPRVTCHKCGLKGHFKNHCPVRKDAEGDEMTDTEEGNTEAAGQEVRRSQHRCEILLNQHGEAHVNPNWILLDSESSEHIFCNKSLVDNVRETSDGEVLRMHSNGGHLDTRTKADFGAIEVWFNENSLANILSLALITDTYRVTMDSLIANALVVHISEGHELRLTVWPKDCMPWTRAILVHPSLIVLLVSYCLLLNKTRIYLVAGM